MTGRSVDEYRAPLFIAWQLTNGCRARCITCCEESGPDKAWPGELSRDEAVRIAREIAAAGVAYAAFGGGEPMGVAHCWEIFEHLAAGGVALKLETDGSRIDEAAAARLAELRFDCVQISVDGATAAIHDRVRPGSSHASAIAAIENLSARGIAAQWVFVPTRFNLHEMSDAFQRAHEMGCSAFVTGPLMRLGRASQAWSRIAPAPQEWEEALSRLRERAAVLRSSTALSVYPWDILGELAARMESPQAMLLIVPDGKVKLLNALPFAPADLRRDSLGEAWEAYRRAWRSDEVRDFVARCIANPALLGHANETWPVRVQVTSGTGPRR